MLRGVKRSEVEEGATGRERLPITPPLLRRIKAVWDSQVNDLDIAILWVACCVEFFGFLRAGEFTVPCESGFDPSSHLSWGDLAVDNPGQPSVMSVRPKYGNVQVIGLGIPDCLDSSQQRWSDREAFPASGTLLHLRPLYTTKHIVKPR